MTDADWVAVAFAVFVGILIYVKVPKKVTDALDSKRDEIAKELDDARELREEAQALLAGYQRQQAEAQDQADAIVAQAEADAKALADATRAKLAETLERRTKLAQDKIAQAEAQAIDEVRALAARAATDAARSVLTAEIDDSKGAALIDQGIADVKDNLH
ncbi:MAG: ATP F0F1 synthase subunit B [Alphaproteobacteria bacterium]